MNNKVTLVPESPAGWAIGLVTLSESGEVEAEGFLTRSERDYSDEKRLMLFRTQQEARAYVASRIPASARSPFHRSSSHLDRGRGLQIELKRGGGVI